MKLGVCNAILLLAFFPWLGCSENSTQENQSDVEHRNTRPKVAVKSIQINQGAKHIELACFSSRDFSLAVVDNGANKHKANYKNLAAAMEQHGSVAGVNGGFFEPDFSPTGQMIADGKVTNKFNRKIWVGGVLMVRDGKLAMIDKKNFTGSGNITQLIQSGPWLVVDGKAQTGFKNDTRTPARTFILNDGKDQWALGYCSGSTLNDLAKTLASDEFQQNFKVHDALNLDGGPSSGFWAKKKDGSIQYIKEGWTVRNFIGAVPK